jgi:hypothetical protein
MKTRAGFEGKRCLFEMKASLISGWGNGKNGSLLLLQFQSGDVLRQGMTEVDALGNQSLCSLEST